MAADYARLPAAIRDAAGGGVMPEPELAPGVRSCMSGVVVRASAASRRAL